MSNSPAEWRFVVRLEVADVGSYISAIAWSPNSTHIALITGNACVLGIYGVHVHEVRSGFEIAQQVALRDLDIPLAWSSDDKHIVPKEGTQQCYVTAELGKSSYTRLPNPEYTIYGHPDGSSNFLYTGKKFWLGLLTSIIWLPDHGLIASGDCDGKITLCQKKEVLRTSPASSVNSIALSPDGRYLAAGCADGVVTLWAMGIKREMCHMMVHTNSFFFVTWSPNNQYLIACTSKGVIIWEER